MSKVHSFAELRDLRQLLSAAGGHGHAIDSLPAVDYSRLGALQHSFFEWLVTPDAGTLGTAKVLRAAQSVMRAHQGICLYEILRQESPNRIRHFASFYREELEHVSSLAVSQKLLARGEGLMRIRRDHLPEACVLLFACMPIASAHAGIIRMVFDQCRRLGWGHEIAGRMPAAPRTQNIRRGASLWRRTPQVTNHGPLSQPDWIHRWQRTGDVIATAQEWVIDALNGDGGDAAAAAVPASAKDQIRKAAEGQHHVHHVPVLQQGLQELQAEHVRDHERSATEVGLDSRAITKMFFGEA
jgi:hypothetical protein